MRLRSLHDKQAGKNVNENSPKTDDNLLKKISFIVPDPGSHGVSLRRSEVNVEDYNGHTDAEI